MKRLTMVLTILTLTLAGASLGWAQQVDPLAIGQNNAPAALEGGYQTEAGQFQFLMLASPQGCLNGDPNSKGDRSCKNSTTHLWFYTAACTRVDNLQVPLTKNDVAVLPLHSPAVTSNRVGNVLVAATPPGGPFDQPLLASNAIIGQTWFIDANRGIGRIEDMARSDGNGGNGWTPYRPAHVLLFAPQDNGIDLFGGLIFRCPVGTSLTSRGTPSTTFVLGALLTLGGDMLDLAAQSDGDAPGSALQASLTEANEDTLCDDCQTNGLFATKLSAIVYDLDEKFLRSQDNINCRCLGASIGAGAFSTEVRLGALVIEAKTQETYWEIFTIGQPRNPNNATGDDPSSESLFTAALNVQVVSTVSVNFYTRLFSARDRTNIEP